MARLPHSPLSAEVAGAPALMIFELLSLLVIKGVLSKSDAVRVPVAAADNLRLASEGSARQTSGEAAARYCEIVARWVAESSDPAVNQEEN